MRNIEDLIKVVNAYVERHGLTPKMTYTDPDALIYNIRTMDYTELESKIIKMKNGKTRIGFKVDGKVTSIHA